MFEVIDAPTKEMENSLWQETEELSKTPGWPVSTPFFLGSTTELPTRSTTLNQAGTMKRYSRRRGGSWWPSC